MLFKNNYVKIICVVNE